MSLWLEPGPLLFDDDFGVRLSSFESLEFTEFLAATCESPAKRGKGKEGPYKLNCTNYKLNYHKRPSCVYDELMICNYIHQQFEFKI